MSPALAMTLLVRNEVDIVRDNIEFHLARGVDFIVATDNRSDDGTREVLEEYAQAGVLRIFDEPGRDYSQSRWVTRMVVYAREELGSDWVLNNDADEFWSPSSGNLKTELGARWPPVRLCRRHNMVFPWDQEPGSWRHTLVNRVARPVRRPWRTSRLVDPRTVPAHPLLYFKPTPKALCRTRDLRRVRNGNHWADYRFPVAPLFSRDIDIYHFPIRSFQHFARKVAEGGAACALNGQLGRSQIWHWRRWYAQMQRGELEVAFRQVLPSADRIARDLKSGRVVVDRLFLSTSTADKDRP
jgi:hypothetical protein